MTPTFTPPRPLGPAGTALWDRIWSTRKPWLTFTNDADQVANYCALHDEVVAVEALLDADPQDWRSRNARRMLDSSIERYATALGLNPLGRKRLGAKDSAPVGKLEQLRAARSTKAG
mgnify:CR=1 FL=1